MELNRTQKVMLWKFSAYGFLKNLQFFEPFLYLFLLSKGLTFVRIGLLISVRSLSSYVLEVPTGIIADMTGRRRAMVIAFASYIGAFLVFAIGTTFVAFIPAMLLFGAGEAFRSGTHKAMIMQHLDGEGLDALKVHYYGRTRAVAQLGLAVSAPLAALIVYLAGNYSAVFWATTVPYVGGMLLILTYPRELDGELSGRASAGAMWRHTKESFRAIFRTQELGKVILNAAVFDSFFRVAKDYLQPLLKALALSLPVLAAVGAKQEGAQAAVLVGPVYFALYINAYLSSRNSGRLSDRAGHLGRTLNGLFWALACGFCLAGLFLASGLVPAAVLVMFLFYTLVNLRKPVEIGFVSDRVDKRQRATVLSVEAQTVAILQAVVAPVFGLIADRAGIPYVFLVGGIGLLVLGVPLRLRSSGIRARTAADPAEPAADGSGSSTPG